MLISIEDQARAGQRMLEYIDDPSPERRARIGFMATNLVSFFPDTVEHLADDYPYLPVRQHWESRAATFTNFLHERDTRDPTQAMNITSQDSGL